MTMRSARVVRTGTRTATTGRPRVSSAFPSSWCAFTLSDDHATVRSVLINFYRRFARQRRRGKTRNESHTRLHRCGYIFIYFFPPPRNL
jgi:hypothetical protein